MTQGSVSVLPRSPSLASAFVFFVAMALLVTWLARQQSPLVKEAESGVQVVVLEDYRFQPKRFVWRVGEPVTVKLVNAALPPTGHEHEIMIGQAPFLRSTELGLLPGHGFNVPFFGATQIEILDAKGVSMVMAPNLKVRGGDLEPMPMGGMGLSEKMGMPGMAPEPVGTMAEAPAMEGDAMAMNMGGMSMAMQMYVGSWLSKEERMDLMKDMAEMYGDNMFLIAPGGYLTMRFVVPDKPGLWQIGCFAGEGAHYIAGMRAVLQVVGEEEGH